MLWQHKASLAWLTARSGFITASDVESIIPYTATGKKRDTTDAMMSIYARRHARVIEGSEISTGAAARGHILEPYAVDEFNEITKPHKWMSSLTVPPMHHWDDILVADTSRGIAFSPDALSIAPPPRSQMQAGVVLHKGWLPSNTTMMEIKSYSAERHFKAMMTTSDKLKERWQIAHAMLVCSDIRHAWLCFYNPSTDHPIHVKLYERADLADEMSEIEEALAEYRRFEEKMDAYTENWKGTACVTEEEIIKRETEKNRINPS